MPETFGHRLRQQREQRGIELATIADDTKVNVSLFEALERDDVSRWPAGIFRRSFVRAYARAVGLDPDATVREFLDAHPDPACEAPELPVDAPLPPRSESTGGIRSRIGSTFRALTGDRSAADTPSFGRLAVGAPVNAPASAPLASALDTTAPPALPQMATSKRREIDLPQLARLCDDIAALPRLEDAAALLERAACLLDAPGIIVWEWRPDVGRLVAALAHGYPPALVARMPAVSPDADNATAAAYRSATRVIVGGSDRDHGAVAVPITASTGCVGVLAMELRAGGERDDQVRAAATILAAQLSSAVAHAGAAAVGDRKLA